MLLTADDFELRLTFPETGNERIMTWDPVLGIYKGVDNQLSFNEDTSRWESDWVKDYRFTNNPDPSVYNEESIRMAYDEFKSNGYSEILCQFIEDVSCKP